MQCKFCSEVFQGKPRQKYCSAKCRRSDWMKNNLAKHREYNKKCRLKKPLICKNCGNSIPVELRASGVTLCSDDCRSSRKKQLDKSIRDKLHEEFREIKCRHGCCLCGYKKFGGSLDFHHVDPKKKDKRIDPKNWRGQLDEISKCILVCKNCHYELHDLMRKDVDEYIELIKDKTGHFKE